MVDSQATSYSAQIPDVEVSQVVEPLAEKAIEEGEGPSLEQQKFTLEAESARTKLAHIKAEFNPLYWAKICVGAIALLYVVALSTSLVIYIWYGDKTIHDWHILIVLVSGGYLSIFGILAVLIKGLFAKDKDETPPLSLVEALKAVADTFKSIKG